MIDFDSLFNYSWFMESLDCETGQMVEKEVFVIDCLEGPDGSDYVTVEGLQDWEVDVSLRNFLKNARIKDVVADRVNDVSEGARAFKEAI